MVTTTTTIARFSSRALLAMLGVVVITLGAATAAAVLLGNSGLVGGWVPALVFVVALLLLLGLGAPALWNSAGLRRIARRHPNGLVFLAWRQPTLAPDLPTYLYRKRLSVDVSDRWVPALVDERGISAWSGGFRPKELLLMEWSELGEIATRDFTQLQGRKRFGVAVDVRPFPTPLIVLVGYSTLGLQAGFDRQGTQAFCDATNSLRQDVRPPSD